MKITFARVCLFSVVVLSIIGKAQAQQISGFSTVGVVYQCFNPRPLLRIPICPRQYLKPVVSAYEDTQEDYTAALYYNVQSTSALYNAGSQSRVKFATYTGNPNASGTYIYGPYFNNPGGINGLWTEVTNHIVDFFYVSSLGEYYDPYGFSNYTQTNPDGDYNSGYWFSVYVYGTYIAEASVIVGESYDSTNNQSTNYQGPAVETILYQSFIAPDWINGPPASGCTNDIYAGDNRGNDPNLASYRAMQAITVGVGGYTGINEINAPPAQATGWTYQFSQSVLQGGLIPDNAYNYDFLGQCSSQGINRWGQAPTTNMIPPQPYYEGTNYTSTRLMGTANNPVPLFAFPINWNAYVSLTEPNAATLNIGGSLAGTCYPHHELSVGGHDVATWPPAYENNLGYTTLCLTGVNEFTQSIYYNISLTVP